jgi:hypothetical protein
MIVWPLERMLVLVHNSERRVMDRRVTFPKMFAAVYL